MGLCMCGIVMYLCMCQIVMCGCVYVWDCNVYVCMSGFCKVWVCVCVGLYCEGVCMCGFVMCVRVNEWVL